MSLLFCASLCDVSKTDQKHYRVLDLNGIDPESLAYLKGNLQKREIIMQWIQRIIVDSNKAGIIEVAPPILSRVWQELSIGIVHFNNARKLSDVPFPFPFSQMVWMMLVFFTLCPVPLISSLYVSMATGPFYCLTCVSVFWSVHYIAIEIELPFGNQANALPLAVIQEKFNESLTCFLEEKTQTPPSFSPCGRGSGRTSEMVVVGSVSDFVHNRYDSKYAGGGKLSSLAEAFQDRMELQQEEENLFEELASCRLQIPAAPHRFPKTIFEASAGCDGGGLEVLVAESCDHQEQRPGRPDGAAASSRTAPQPPPPPSAPSSPLAAATAGSCQGCQAAGGSLPSAAPGSGKETQPTSSQRRPSSSSSSGQNQQSQEQQEQPGHDRSAAARADVAAAGAAGTVMLPAPSYYTLGRGDSFNAF